MAKLTGSKRRKIAFQISASLALIFFFLFFLEILVRLLLPQLGMSAEIRVPDPILHHSFVSGAETVMNSPEFKVSYKINSFGLRDREIEPKKPGVFRILALGDSVVEGWGVELEQSWVKQLEKNLNENFGEGKFEVINGGVASYSPLLYYLFLKEKGLKLQPDLVIMMMDMGDPSDDYAYVKSTVFKGREPLACPGDYYQTSGFKRVFKKLSFFLRRSSRLYILLEYFLSGEGSDGFRPVPFVFKEVPGYKKAWELSQQYILLSQRLLEKEKIPLLFTVNPPAVALGENEWVEGRKKFNYAANPGYFRKFFDEFSDFCKKNRLFYIDIYHRLLSYPEHPLYYSYDIHPNPMGHKVIADYIFEELIKGGFLGKITE